VKAGIIKEGEKVRFGFHNFRRALATALVKLKVDAKTVQGIVRHEDFGTTMQLYAQSRCAGAVIGRQDSPAHGEGSVRKSWVGFHGFKGSDLTFNIGNLCFSFRSYPRVRGCCDTRSDSNSPISLSEKPSSFAR
jgi:hypothetical protein